MAGGWDQREGPTAVGRRLSTRRIMAVVRFSDVEAQTTQIRWKSLFGMIWIYSIQIQRLTGPRGKLARIYSWLALGLTHGVDASITETRVEHEGVEELSHLL
ncbi:hypothetical protein V6N13_148681 [Hibiscus sabdariffa]